jgi:hypothetical protein
MSGGALATRSCVFLLVRHEREPEGGLFVMGVSTSFTTPCLHFGCILDTRRIFLCVDFFLIMIVRIAEK